MSVLSRKMFAKGDVANVGSRATVDIGPNMPTYTSGDVRRLIEFYVSQGLNSIDIQERISPLTGISMKDIEQLILESGGSINPSVNTPAVIDPNAVFVPEPQAETVVTPSGGLPTVQPTPPELPTIEDISQPAQINSAVAELQEERTNLEKELAELIENNKPKKRLGIPMTMDGEPIMVNDEAIEQKRKSINRINQSIEYYKKNPPAPSTPDIPIEMEPPTISEFLKDKVDTTVKETEQEDDGLPDVGVSDLSGNQYKTSDGIIHNIDPAAFKELLSKESSRIIQGILLNPNVEYGQDLIDIIEAEALGRSSTLVDQEKIKVGGENVILNPESIGDETLKFIVDVGKEGVEGIYNTLRSLGGSRMVGIFRGREAGQKAKEAGRDEYVDLFDTPLSSQGTIAENLAEISGYGATGGETAGTLDSIVLESSIGQDTTQSLTDIANEEKTTEEEQGRIDEAAGETTGTSADPAASDDPEKEGDDKEGKDDAPGGIKVVNQDDNDGAQEISNSLFGNFANFFNSEENLRMARNVGKALTATGDLTGIGIGAAAAAEERKLEEELAKKRLFDLAGSGAADVTDRKKILDVQTAMNDSIADYNNAVAAEELTTGVLNILADPSSGNITTFANKIGIRVDEFLNAAGVKSTTDIEKMEPGKRAKVMLKILTNRNIKERLGESGRTISNIDRQIAERIISSLELFKLEDDVATMKLKLQENLRSITTKKDNSQRNIKNSVMFLAPYDANILSRDSELFSIYVDELGFAPPSQSIGSPAGGDDAIQIDATK